jgi:predicted nucleic acid-binding protein
MSGRSTLVTDTGVLFAALVEGDDDHRRCRALLSSRVAVAVPAPVISEVDWLGRSRGYPGVGARLLESVLDESVLVVDLDWDGWARVLELVGQYSDLPLNIVDASVVAVAERLEQDAIATLDRRHFSVVQPRHVRNFELLPD